MNTLQPASDPAGTDTDRPLGPGRPRGPRPRPPIIHRKHKSAKLRKSRKGTKYLSVSLIDFMAWCNSQPAGTILVHGMPAERSNEIEYIDAIDQAAAGKMATHPLNPKTFKPAEPTLPTGKPIPEPPEPPAEGELQLQLLRANQVVEYTGLSKPSLYKYRKEGRFPAGLRLGARTRVWRKADVDQWLADLRA